MEEARSGAEVSSVFSEVPKKPKSVLSGKRLHWDREVTARAPRGVCCGAKASHAANPTTAIATAEIVLVEREKSLMMNFGDCCFFACLLVCRFPVLGPSFALEL